MKPRARGFALVELLVALGLSAAILAAIYSMLYTGAKAWKSLKQRSELYQTGRVILETIETDLENAVPLRPVPFAGGASSLSFAAAVTFSDGREKSADRRALARVCYRWGGEPADSVLERSWEPLLPEPSDAALPAAQPFPDLLREFSVAYAYRDGEAPGVAWNPEWKQPGPPEGVRVKILLKHPDSLETLALEKTIHLFAGALGRAS